MREKLKVKGYLVIKNGDTVVRGKNHFVDGMMKMIISFLGAKITVTGQKSAPLYHWSIYLGSDTSTPTTHDMTSLVSPIGSAPGTPPDYKGGLLDNPSPGVYRVEYIATWFTGSISGTVGEVALYLTTTDRFSWSDGGWYCNAGENMVSRSSAADRTLQQFTINPSKPLSVTWTIEFKLV